MKTKLLGNTNIAVTPVGMGVLTIGPSQLARSLEEGARVVRYALEQGINLLDTAEYYRCYHYIKKAFKDLGPSFAQNALPRPVMASKSLAYDYEGMRRAIDECRSALDLDQIDIFMMHEVEDAPNFEQRSGAWACLQDAKAKGRIKAVGISTHFVDVALEAVNTHGVDVLFTLINYQGLGIRKGPGFAAKEEMESAIRAASEKSIGVLAMKALGGGNLLSGYVKALEYASNLPGITSVMIGLGNKKDVDDAVDFFEGNMPQDYMPDVSQKRMFVDRSDCARCGACVRYCTSKAISYDEDGIAAVDTQKCVRCGYCVLTCPTRALLFL